MKAYMAPELRKQYCGPGRDRTCDQRIMSPLTGKALTCGDGCLGWSESGSGYRTLAVISTLLRVECGLFVACADAHHPRRGVQTSGVRVSRCSNTWKEAYHPSWSPSRMKAGASHTEGRRGHGQRTVDGESRARGAKNHGSDNTDSGSAGGRGGNGRDGCGHGRSSRRVRRPAGFVATPHRRR